MFWSTSECAPMVTLFPIVTLPPRMDELQPISTWSPMTIIASALSVRNPMVMPCFRSAKSPITQLSVITMPFRWAMFKPLPILQDREISTLCRYLRRFSILRAMRFWTYYSGHRAMKQYATRTGSVSSGCVGYEVTLYAMKRICHGQWLQGGYILSVHCTKSYCHPD